jgi:NitT/TauT family transport system substrate-binding protein
VPLDPLCHDAEPRFGSNKKSACDGGWTITDHRIKLGNKICPLFAGSLFKGSSLSRRGIWKGRNLAMAPPQTRRQFLSTLSLAGATALFGVCPSALADEPPETRTIRFAKNASICVFPQFYLQETLRAEGFSEIGYVEASAVRTLEPIARGTADFAVSFGLGQILEIDAGSPITILGGVHVGCYELFAQESIRSVPELKGKSVGLETASPALLKLMAANVGLDPEKDFNWVTDRKQKPLELFAAGKIDAFLGFPPEPQELHARRVGHVVLSTTADRPWSDYYCCMLAGNADFIRTHPVAAKRVLRAVLKNTDLCATNPAEVARRLVEGGFTPRYDYAFQTLQQNPYDKWREYDPADTIRFYALRLREAGMIKSSPQKILAENTDWHFFNELKRELKA